MLKQNTFRAAIMEESDKGLQSVESAWLPVRTHTRLTIPFWTVDLARSSATLLRFWFTGWRSLEGVENILAKKTLHTAFCDSLSCDICIQIWSRQFLKSGEAEK